MGQYAGTLAERELPDGRVIVVYPLIMGTARVCIGPAGADFYDDAWCYATPVEAIAACEAWDGEGDPPVGWFRHIGTGRRRPDGDPAREYVRA